MQKKIIESIVIFISVLKWVFLATVVGIIVGGSTTLFIKLLNVSISYTSNYPYYYLLLPVAFFLSAFLVDIFAKDAAGHGTEKVIEAVHKRSGKINGAVVPVKLLATIITLVSGGSAGKEGPCAQIGGGLSSIFADFFRFGDKDRRKLVICGISAGFASVFGTPIAGAIFGVEVLFVGSILYDVLLPSFIAGITAYQVSTSFGAAYFNAPLNFVPVFSESFFLIVILSGIFFGLCSFFLIEVMRSFNSLARKIKIWDPYKGLIGGFSLILLTLIFSKQYLGLGLDTILSNLHGTVAPWYTFIVKTVFTSITLAFGGSGGIVTPIFFIGATAGSFFAHIFHLDPATFAAIGFLSLLAGAANTPIAASIMAVELFGPQVASYAAVACVISFLMTGHRSVYPSQILSMTKSASLNAEIGKNIEEAHSAFNKREKGLIMRVWRLIKIAMRSDSAPAKNIRK
ncbi:MAG: chloride channel protein [bacterium]